MKLTNLKEGMECTDKGNKKFTISGKDKAWFGKEHFTLSQFYDVDMLAIDRNDDYMDIMKVVFDGEVLFERDEKTIEETIKLKEILKSYLDREQAEAKILKWIKENDDVELDWHDVNKFKYNVIYSGANDLLGISHTTFSLYLPKEFYLSSLERAQKLIDELGNELLIWFGVKKKKDL